MMKTLFRTIPVFLLLLSSCCQVNIKGAPEFSGTDSRVKPFMSNYFWLSRHNNIQFNGSVTIGIRRLGMSDSDGKVVGLCTYGAGFREITLDEDYWNKATYLGRLAVIWHESGHCYCGRGHDHDNGEDYPKTTLEKLEEGFWGLFRSGPKRGYYSDGCPTSLMFPNTIKDKCVIDHFNAYSEEIFQNCNPY